MVITATLGHQSLNQGLLAGLVGLALVALFLLVLYRFLGLVARHAKPIGIDLAEQRHGRGVAVRGAVGGKPKGGEKVAALKRREGGIRSGRKHRRHAGCAEP